MSLSYQDRVRSIYAQGVSHAVPSPSKPHVYPGCGPDIVSYVQLADRQFRGLATSGGSDVEARGAMAEITVQWYKSNASYLWSERSAVTYEGDKHGRILHGRVGLTL